MKYILEIFTINVVQNIFEKNVQSKNMMSSDTNEMNRGK